MLLGGVFQVSKCKRQAGVEHETIAFPHFRSCASCLLYVGLDHLPLHGRRQLVLRFVVCVHPQNFSLCSKNSGNYVYNVKNCWLALQGSPTVSLEANPLTYNMASLLCSPHICHAETWIQKTRGQECIKLSFISPINQLSILFPHIFVIVTSSFCE